MLMAGSEMSQLRSHKPPGFIQLFLKLTLRNSSISPRILTDCDLLVVTWMEEVAEGSECLEICVEH